MMKKIVLNYKVFKNCDLLPCCPELTPQISGIDCPVFVEIVKISWQRPPLASVVRDGALVVNCSKSSLTSQTAKNYSHQLKSCISNYHSNVF